MLNVTINGRKNNDIRIYLYLCRHQQKGGIKMLNKTEVKVLSSFIGKYTMTNYYLCKAMYQMMAYDSCLNKEKGEIK